jgi:hypothetical protein
MEFWFLLVGIWIYWQLASYIDVLFERATLSLPQGPTPDLVKIKTTGEQAKQPSSVVVSYP